MAWMLACALVPACAREVAGGGPAVMGADWDMVTFLGLRREVAHGTVTSAETVTDRHRAARACMHA